MDLTTDGHRLIAEGREAEIYEWGDGRVLRLMRTEAQRDAMDLSTAAIAAARAFDIPTPAVFEIVRVDGRPGQVMERIDGVDQLAFVGARPWKLRAVARDFAEIHVALHDTVVDDELPSVQDLFQRRVAGSDLVPPELAAAAAAALADLPSGSALCHGDFHPGNVLVGRDGAVVIDWTNAARGHPMADVARTRLLLQIADLPEGTPATVRVLARVARSAFWSLYLRHYARQGTLDLSLADRWDAVGAVARLAEGFDGERPELLARARSGFDLPPRDLE